MIIIIIMIITIMTVFIYLHLNVLLRSSYTSFTLKYNLTALGLNRCIEIN